MSASRSIAVIGSGISGLSAAWLLAQRHNVTLFEREGRLGGHSNTVDVPFAEGKIAVDTGFIVYNVESYPNLIALFDHLGVETTPTNMGFAVSLDGGRYEYSGDGLKGLMGQRRNLVSPAHWRMIRDTLRFFREARATAASDTVINETLGGYLKRNQYSPAFIERHILPMAAAIWSTPSSDVMAFPAAAFMRFFDNHGLLQVANRPQWRTVVGGSRQYVEKLGADFRGRIVLNAGVHSVKRSVSGVEVGHATGMTRFDDCVIACHADDALALLSDADSRERNLLGAFAYVKNLAVLHTDATHMPKRRKLWSSWNYLGSGVGNDRTLAVTYWMNALQPLGTSRDLFVTLNPVTPIAEGAEIARFNYSHPLFDQRAMHAQADLWSLQGRRHTWFCGSYFGYGFHEDGLQSGLAVAEELGGTSRPWNVPNPSSRIRVTKRTTPVSERAEAAE